MKEKPRSYQCAPASDTEHVICLERSDVAVFEIHASQGSTIDISVLDHKGESPLIIGSLTPADAVHMAQALMRLVGKMRHSECPECWQGVIIDSSSLEIQRCDQCHRFPGDADAGEFVGLLLGQPPKKDLYDDGERDESFNEFGGNLDKAMSCFVPEE